MQVDIVTSLIVLVGLIAGVYWSSRPANKNLKEEDVL
jgi:uncharacterized protein YneF (UPF0154 family)